MAFRTSAQTHGAIKVPVARGRLISTRLPALEANLWRALKPTSDWTSASVRLFAPSTTPGVWSKLVNDVRRNNGTSGHLVHEVNDRIHYALGGAPPTINPPNAGEGRDGRLEVVLETLREAEFRLFSRSTWKFCEAYDFTFDFPSGVRASTRATRAPVRPLHDRAEAVWQQAAADGTDDSLDDDAEIMPVLLFHRGVGTVKESGMYLERKLGLITLYIQRAVLHLLCRVVCKLACVFFKKVGVLEKRCTRIEAWGDAPPSAGDVSPALMGTRKDAPARFVRRALLPQQLPTLESVVRAFFKTVTLEEITLREVVTVSARAPAVFAETDTKFDLAMYDEIPCADAEMLCDVELFLRPLDRLKIGVTAAAALYVCVPMLVNMWFRRDEGLAMHHVLFVMSLGGAISKILASFHASRDAAQTRLERMLLKRTESKQEGVLLTLASAAYKQECKEELLGYAALFSLTQASIAELRDRAEEIVEFRGTRPADFEAHSHAPAEEMRIDFDAIGAASKLLRHFRAKSYTALDLALTANNAVHLFRTETPDDAYDDDTRCIVAPSAAGHSTLKPGDIIISVGKNAHVTTAEEASAATAGATLDYPVSVHLFRRLPFRLALQMIEAVVSGDADALSIANVRLIPLPLAEAAIGNDSRARGKVELKKSAVRAFVSSLTKKVRSRDGASASPHSPPPPALSPVSPMERLRRGLFKRRDHST